MSSPRNHVPCLEWKNGRAFLGGAALDECAMRYETPLYVYDFEHALARARELQTSLQTRPHLVCYAVKANSSYALLKAFANEGLGADVVSGGELLLARKAGISADKIVFSGVAKSNEEIALGISEGILCFNVESPGEIPRIIAAAKSQNRRAAVSLRVNPDIDARTHPKIATGLHATKFGMETSAALQVADKLLQNAHATLIGVDCHIGSQLLDLEPMMEAARLVRNFADLLRGRGHQITSIDLGGGLGVAYEPGDVRTMPTMAQYGAMLTAAMAGDPARLVIEPGRCLVAECGVLVTKVIEVKKTGAKTFVMVDAAMNDLVRPSMYEAYHHIVPVFRRAEAPEVSVDVVGPVCETGDYFAFDRTIPLPKEGDLLVITHAGAYGYSMASNYNMRPRPAEVAVSRGVHRVIRKREKLADLWANELS